MEEKPGLDGQEFKELFVEYPPLPQSDSEMEDMASRKPKEVLFPSGNVGWIDPGK